MNLYFDGKVENSMEKNPDVSLTVFRKVDEGWEKLLDPFNAKESKNLPKIEEWRKTITLSLALNQPMGDRVCKVTKLENGKSEGPRPAGNFKWEVDITSNYESWQDPNNTVFCIEVCDPGE